MNAYNTIRCLCWCVSGSWGSNCGEGSFPATAMVTQSKLSKADSVRERELFRYYSPSNSTAPAPSPSHGVPKDVDPNTLSAHQASSPNTILTALAQLCALRLHASRAMIRWVSYKDFRFNPIEKLTSVTVWCPRKPSTSLPNQPRPST